MNWQQVTQSFLPLSREQTSSFAPPREIDLAIAAYNRAIRNLNQDSADIALIALRKLASDYPDFLEASLLYGCCLAQLGQLAEAREQLIRTRNHASLPSDLEDATNAALKAAEDDIAVQAALIASGKSAPDHNASDMPASSTAAVLERTGRRARVHMASARERRDVIRRGDMAQDTETHVVMTSSPADLIRKFLPVTGVLILVVLAVLFATQVLPNIHFDASNASADSRLTYLLTQIEKKAASDTEWQKLLVEYQAHFDPAPTSVITSAPLGTSASSSAAATGQTGETNASVPTTTTLTTTSPPTTNVPASPVFASALLSANTLYQEAVAVKGTDLIMAAEKLYQVIEQLKAIPTETTAIGVSPNASGLLSDARAQYELIYKDAAERLRLLADPLFDQSQYQNALPYYLRAYKLYPASFGGGVAYYCGRCYQLLKQPNQARPYYEYVVATFAGKSIAASSASRLRELG